MASSSTTSHDHFTRVVKKVGAMVASSSTTSHDHFTRVVKKVGAMDPDHFLRRDRAPLCPTRFNRIVGRFDGLEKKLEGTVSASSTRLDALEHATKAFDELRPGVDGLIDDLRGEFPLRHQLNKTLDARLRRVWATRDWHRKVTLFASLFTGLLNSTLLTPTSRALCVGARLGQEVAALRQVGVPNSVGIDLAPAPPLVVKGDFHDQPFDDDTFDFEFSNVFDHALYPDRFAREVERTLRPGGVAVIHVAVHRRGDKYSANDLLDVRGLVGLFPRREVVKVNKVDAFGLDTEVILRKKKR